MASSLVLALPAAALEPNPPCTACVTWRATPEDARALVEAPGRLEGLEVVVTVEMPTDMARTDEVVRALTARGAAVAVEVPLESGPDDIAPLARVAGRILWRVPEGAAADDALVYAIRTRATEVRALAPAAVIGLAGPAPVLAALAAKGIGPYVSFLASSAPVETIAGLDTWITAAAPDSLDGLLGATA
ncbi:MAG TPA: hypothetical protein VFK70_04745, partial [Vicinamibacteria bacterium]|nr:hypothetical protein [Vicinamibacteria bacterium]